VRYWREENKGLRDRENRGHMNKIILIFRGMSKILVTWIICLLVSSCISLNQFVVTPVGEEPASYSQRFIYSLPQTVLEARMEFEKTIYLPGPYRQYAEKYLGISKFIKEEKVNWEITGIDVSVFSEPDPSQYYSVNLIRGTFQTEKYFELAQQGLVIDPMTAFSSNVTLPTSYQTALPAVLEFSMKRNHKEKTDTLYKTVITDSSFVKIPILRKQKEAKTIEQKAEEAANLIIKIRKRRLKLVTGEYALFPEGKALEIAIEELDRTEKEYISLFTGKTYTERYSRSFFIVPSGNDEKTVFMNFSESKGLLPKESHEGKAVAIELKPNEGYPIGISRNEQIQKNTLYYRVPATCLVQITGTNDLLFEGRMSVFQAGSIFTLPLKKSK
jgi:hypothetical protein